MFPFPNFLGESSFKAQLEASLVRGGAGRLAYAETNKYEIKQQVLNVHEVRTSCAIICCGSCACRPCCGSSGTPVS
jgi:hypothetical protein